MRLAFTAEQVSYSEAIGGDLIQVSFSERKDLGEADVKELMASTSLYLGVSVLYEFSFEPSIEWCDGTTCDGGANVSSYVLDRDSLRMHLDNDMHFQIAFKIDHATYRQIETFFQRTFRQGGA